MGILDEDDELNALFDEVDGLDSDQPTPPTPPGEAKDFFGPYQLVQPLGSGGVAQVWRTRHIHPNYGSRTLALKILHTQHGEDQRIMDLFRREAYVLAMLKHPNVVETFEAGVHDEKFFIAMEDVDGKDLEFLVGRCKKLKLRLPIFLIIHIICETLRALSYAHALKDGEAQPLNLIHRDINPANVFISYRGEVKLGDFGVASIAASMGKKNELAGKPGYFAPEQLLQKDVDQRADIFAVGVMLFELLAGQRLFSGKDMNDTLLINRKARVPKLRKLCPDVPPELEAIAMKALQPKPKYRYASADAMLEELQPFALEPSVNQLAIRSMIRKSFRAEYVTSLQLKRGLEGEALPSLGGMNVLLICQDARASSALSNLLGKYGATGHVYARAEPAVFDKNYDLALVDGNDLQALQSFVPFRMSQEHGIPTVVFADKMDDRAIERVVLIRPDEFIFKPFTEDGFLRTLQAVLMNPNEPDNVVSLNSKRVEKVHQARRIIFLSENAQRLGALSASFVEQNCSVTSLSTLTDMAEVLAEFTPDGLIVDRGPTLTAELVAQALKRVQGILDLPTVVLDPSVDKVQAQPGRLLMKAPLSQSAEHLLEVLSKFWVDGLIRRCFERYDASYPAEIRYAGRVMNAETINLSRGGAKVQSTQQMPPLNTEVGLTIRVSTRDSIDATCRVARVDLPEDAANSAAHIGLAFKALPSQQEKLLLSLIRSLSGSEPPLASTA